MFHLDNCLTGAKMRAPSLRAPTAFVRSFVGLHSEFWGTQKTSVNVC
jgi:hypothetical protein